MSYDVRSAIGLAVWLALAVHALPARASAPLDWCAPMAVRADSRWWSYSPCESWWKPDTIARDADFVFGGFATPAAPNAVTPDTWGCTGATSQATSRAYHDDLRARAAARGRTLTIVYMGRFDLVNRAFAAAPGFDASFLVDSAVPFSQALDFFHLDNSVPCTCGCDWGDGPGPASVPPGTRLRDLIDASGGPNAYQSKVYYAIRPSSGGTVEGAPRTFYGSSAIADQTNPAYRAWMIQQTREILVAGGFDAVELNHKLHQYLPTQVPPWWGGPKAPTVEQYLSADDTLWSGRPAHYGYAEYLAGWSALADDLTAAALPFTVLLSTAVWRANDYYDDPATPALDEGTLIRGVARKAKYVFLERNSGVSDAEWAAILLDIQAPGTATVVPVQTGCGFGGPDAPVVSPPALTAGLTVAPEVGATGAYTGTSTSVVPGGTSTGAWDADFWCRCPAPPCGPSDASTRGRTATSWTLPAGLCDAAYTGAPGSYTARARVTRGGVTIDATDRVTICAPACSNGRDDDGDGRVDFPADPGCASAGSPFESPQCKDGRDNDGDGLIDLADPQCSALPANPREVSSCGLGPELAALLAALAGVRVARRRAGRSKSPLE